jgi:hypothetical protein
MLFVQKCCVFMLVNRREVFSDEVPSFGVINNQMEIKWRFSYQRKHENCAT